MAEAASRAALRDARIGAANDKKIAMVDFGEDPKANRLEGDRIE